MLLDSHAHYEDARFNEDRDELLTALPAMGVGLIVDIGCDPQGAERAVELAERYPHVYAAVGLHPQEAGRYTEKDLERIAELAQHPKVRAIGEIGLDYHYDDDAPREVQIELFTRQMELARRLGMPVCIHDREAHADALEIVKRFPDIRSVFHCFSGSIETAKELLKLDCYFGFNGVITFKNARKSGPVVQALPLDRILLETDCPYLAPEPYRGRRCDSSMMYRTAERIAELRGIGTEEVAAATTENACRFYGIASMKEE